MPYDDAALLLMANAIDAAITHARLHSADPGTGESNAIGTRTAFAQTSDADGDLTLDAPINFTGLGANATVAFITLWSNGTAGSGTRYGKYAITGDATANAAGEYTITTLTNNSTAS